MDRLERFAATGDLEELLVGLPSEQVRLLEEGCVRCGHVQSLLIEQNDGMACIECITRENGEDGDGQSQ